MESVIYYFSATGNSLRIANIMAERMDGLLLPMSKYKGTKCGSRQIGLVFPTYFWGVPRTVAEFVEITHMCLQPQPAEGLPEVYWGIWTHFLRKRGFILIME